MRSFCMDGLRRVANVVCMALFPEAPKHLEEDTGLCGGYSASNRGEEVWWRVVRGYGLIPPSLFRHKCNQIDLFLLNIYSMAIILHV